MNREQINKIYDKFPPDKQDMSRAEFHKAIRGLSDPVKMQDDLARIELLKARERSNRLRIEQGLKKRS